MRRTKYKSHRDPPLPIAVSLVGGNPVNDTAVSMRQSFDNLIYSYDSPKVKGHWIRSNPMLATHFQDEYTSQKFYSEYLGPRYSSRGRIRITCPSLVKFTDADIATVSNTYSDSAGATAISRSRPGDSLASLSQFLAELKKDGIPSLIYDRRRISSSIDDIFNTTGFLNNQFGIKPVLKDIQQLYEATLDLDKALAQLERDSGRIIRRTIKLPDLNETASGFDDRYTCISGRYTGATFGTGSWTVTEKRDHFFVGRYRYFLDRKVGTRNHFGDTSGGFDRTYVAHLYGAVPNVELLWNLLPWTWLADYYGNAGDIIHNATSNAADNLVIKDASVFTKWTRTRTDSATFKVKSTGNSWQDITASRKQKMVINRRNIANPFSFGPTLGSLNDRQKAIVAAVGYNQRSRTRVD